jgi:hypothetical protein
MNDVFTFCIECQTKSLSLITVIFLKHLTATSMKLSTSLTVELEAAGWCGTTSMARVDIFPAQGGQVDE